jgi:hypothetical protein
MKKPIGYVEATPPPVSERAMQWLRDAPDLSAEILAALSAQPEPPDPEPEPIPPTESDMDYPKTESELRQCLQSYADNDIVGLLDPRTKVELSSTIEIVKHAASGSPWGVNGNYAKVNWRGPAGHDVLRYIGKQDVPNRALTIERLVINGGDPYMNRTGAKACLNLSAPLGDAGPIYKFTIRDVFAMEAEYGVVLEGGVYEGMMENVHAENCTKDGIFMRHMNLGQSGQGVVSNVLLIHPNCSRNLGAGINCVYSVYIIGGGFILNGNGAIRAPDGLRGAIMCNGENTAGPEGAAFVVPHNGYGSVINLCEGSSDGSTHCRRWNGTAWESIGSPMLYLMAIAGGVKQADNHVSYYGSGSNPMAVVKPAGRAG